MVKDQEREGSYGNFKIIYLIIILYFNYLFLIIYFLLFYIFNYYFIYLFYGNYRP